MRYASILVTGILLAGCATDHPQEAKTTEATKTADVSTPAKAPEVAAPAKAPEVAAPAKAPEVAAPAKAPEVEAPAKAPEAAAPAKVPPAADAPAKTPEIEAPAKAPEAVAAPAHSNEPKNLYFETTHDGKTYVLAYVSTMQLVQKGEAPPTVVAKAGLGPEGETVYVETDGAGLEKRLTDEYTKQHPKK